MLGYQYFRYGRYIYYICVYYVSKFIFCWGFQVGALQVEINVFVSVDVQVFGYSKFFGIQVVVVGVEYIREVWAQVFVVFVLQWVFGVQVDVVVDEDNIICFNIGVDIICGIGNDQVLNVYCCYDLYWESNLFGGIVFIVVEMFCYSYYWYVFQVFEDQFVFMVLYC